MSFKRYSSCLTLLLYSTPLLCLVALVQLEWIEFEEVWLGEIGCSIRMRLGWSSIDLRNDPKQEPNSARATAEASTVRKRVGLSDITTYFSDDEKFFAYEDVSTNDEITET